MKSYKIDKNHTTTRYTAQPQTARFQLPPWTAVPSCQPHMSVCLGLGKAHFWTRVYINACGTHWQVIVVFIKNISG